MTQGFDEWFKDNELSGWVDKDWSMLAYEAGAASRQAEIDELQKRIDEIENHVGINYDCEREDDQHSYWSGYNQAMREINIILHGEGESNE